jgi:PAS domain S-box-containing protein
MSKPTSPLITVIIYAICAVIWALFVDFLITLLTGHVDPKLLTWLLHYKGIVFALLSSIALYLLFKNYRNKLNASEKAYIRMFRENPQPMWIYSKQDFRFLEVNDAAVGLYGYTREEFLQMTILDIRPKEDITRLRENLEYPALTGYSSAGIWRHCKKDGSLMYAKIESFVIAYGGEAAEVISIFDVTAAHLAGEALNKQEQLLKTIINSSQNMIWAVNAQLEIIAANRIFKGRSALLSGIDEPSSFWKTHYEKSLRGEKLLIDLEAESGEETWKYMEISFDPIFHHGTITGVACMARDVTDRKLQELEIRRLSLVASMTNNPVIITDHHACIEWVNKSFEDLSGYMLEEIKGLQPHAFLHGEGTNTEVVHEIREKLAASQPCVVEILNYTSTGEPYWVLMDITPITDASGEVERHVIIQTNITEKKKFEQQLEEKNRLLMDVAFISSHRLRMPVASLLGLFAQLDKEHLANPDNLPLLLHIEKLVNNMDAMLHEMADKCNQIYSRSGQVNSGNFNKP